MGIRRVLVVMVALLMVNGGLLAHAPMEQTAHTVTLPIKIGDNRVAVGTVVNGQTPVQVVLDTGSAVSLFPHEHFSKVDSISFGDITFRDFPVIDTLKAIPDATYFFCLTKDEILIGTTLLNRAIWQFNFHDKTVTITDDVDNLTNIDGAFSLPIEMAEENGSTGTHATSLGKYVSVILDTGSPFVFNTTPETYRTARGRVTSTTPHYTVTGRVASLTGSDGVLGRLPEFEFGDLSLPNLSVDAATGGDYAFNIIGNGLFSYFVTTFDFLDEKLYLYPADTDYLKAIQTEPPGYGFAITREDDQMKVVRLVTPSPAASAGLQVGDQILQINDDDYRDFTYGEYCPIGKVGGTSRDVSGYYHGPLTVTVERDKQILTLNVGEPVALRPFGDDV